MLRGERNREISDLPDKCSFLDSEPLCHHKRYLGRRVERGLFRASDGRLINADVNGSYNILRKAIPDAFKNGLTGLLLHPVRLLLERPCELPKPLGLGSSPSNPGLCFDLAFQLLRRFQQAFDRL